MTAKKTTKAIKTGNVWEETSSVVVPEKVGDSPEEGSPFGSRTSLMLLIQGFRKHVKENPIEMRGRATAPDSTVYGYYLSEDVLNAATDYVEANKGQLDLGMYVGHEGINVMRLQLTEISTGQTKVVEVNLGKVATTSELGARITYAPKYLVAMMFGISVQTDSDAFNNGKTIKNESGHNEPLVSSTVHITNSSTVSTGHEVSGLVVGGPVPASDSVGSSSLDSSRDSKEVIPHSQSYPVARQFIERALSSDMLNTAEAKVKSAKQLHDFERVELAALIAEKRKVVK